ncbi:RNA polymerase sigma-70 factor (ECF subfamily) [Silvimonas terrae]|uniref:RNA polymerase sigma-70 factor (ECF subfamily) n=1 Tax=Silvimonas terrae TaxID=300266 RepID=A0A840R7Z1_9NEIS|nr:sigma-70 family RNA polymerase sigma factor [Silvimonas terrae]MBB5189405.1 RNA polymerase sigma-70 factor (ECF subfamily) [Silvimonas terrae]
MPRTTDPDGALFERLRPRLKAISHRIVGSEAEAEDIVQDCFLKWQSADQSALGTPVAWLTTVVQHQSIDRLRKRHRDLLTAQAAQELTPADDPASPEKELLRRAELGAALAGLLAHLSPAERLAVVLHEVLECEHADIAAVLGISIVNARQHLARARRRLREAQTGAALPASTPPGREQIQRFQNALNGQDVPALLTLLGASTNPPQTGPQCHFGMSANDAVYCMAMAA